MKKNLIYYSIATFALLGILNTTATAQRRVEAAAKPAANTEYNTPAPSGSSTVTEFSQALRKIIADAPNNFSNLKAKPHGYLMWNGIISIADVRESALIEEYMSGKYNYTMKVLTKATVAECGKVADEYRAIVLKALGAGYKFTPSTGPLQSQKIGGTFKSRSSEMYVTLLGNIANIGNDNYVLVLTVYTK